jgi:hypothetical protein
MCKQVSVVLYAIAIEAVEDLEKGEQIEDIVTVAIKLGYGVR